MNTTFLNKFLGYFKEIWFLWVLCFIFNIITFFTVFYKIHPGNGTLALHYNILVGVEWYGKGKNLYFIPGVGLAMAIVNIIVYRALKKSENFLSFLTAFVSLLIQIILLVSVLFLSTVN